MKQLGNTLPPDAGMHGLLLSALGFLKDLLPTVWRWIKPPHKLTPPRLDIVLNELESGWSPGAWGHEPAVNVHVIWSVTNRTDSDARIVKGVLTRTLPRRWYAWPLRRSRQVTQGMMMGFSIHHRGAGDVLPPHAQADFSAMFPVLGQHPAERALVVGRVTLVDNLDNNYHFALTLKQPRFRFSP